MKNNTVKNFQNQCDKTDIIIRVLTKFQEIDADFPIQYARSLMEISQNEGLSVTELAKKIGKSLSTTSRIVGALSQYGQSGKSYDLVNVCISKQERRRKELYLTDKGLTTVEDLCSTLAL